MLLHLNTFNYLFQQIIYQTKSGKNVIWMRIVQSFPNKILSTFICLQMQRNLNKSEKVLNRNGVKNVSHFTKLYK